MDLKTDKHIVQFRELRAEVFLIKIIKCHSDSF